MSTFGGAAAAATPRAAAYDDDWKHEEEEEEVEFLLPETEHVMEELAMLSSACDEISFRIQQVVDKLKTK